MSKCFRKCLYGYFNSIFTHSFWWVFIEYPFGKFNRWRIGEQFNPCFLRFCKNLLLFHQNRGCIVSPVFHRVNCRFLQSGLPVISFNTFRSNFRPFQSRFSKKSCQSNQFTKNLPFQKCPNEKKLISLIWKETKIRSEKWRYKKAINYLESKKLNKFISCLNDRI